MVTIRRWSKADERAVLDLITSVMSQEFKDAVAAYPMEDVERVDTAYGGIGEAFFVAVVDQNKVVGTVAIKKEDDRVALLRRLFVAPTHRNLKIGKKLVERALADRIRVLLISTLMLNSALRVRDLVDGLRAAGQDTKVIVGGAPFRFDPELWREVRADAMGYSASDVTDIVRIVMGGVS